MASAFASVNGIVMGIAPEFLGQVFDRFRQADATTTRRYGGLGLGLSIVKNLTELHGGNMRVASQGPGPGARCHVYGQSTVAGNPPRARSRSRSTVQRGGG